MPIAPAVTRFLYRHVLKKALFCRDPERVHDAMTRVGMFLGAHGATRRMTSMAFSFADRRLEQNILGIRFPNPVGLSAGFDKNAVLTDILPSVGFGFVEVGSITGEPCEGNRKPRLWRLPESKALVVYYGLKNDGCEAISDRLRAKRFAVPVGASIAKTNSPATVDPEAAIADYAKAFARFSGIGSYLTVNISCPNAYGGEPFTDPVLLERLLAALDDIPTSKPIFLKLSPDLAPADLDAILAVAGAHMVAGVICSNLTKRRDNGKIRDAAIPPKGGISGKVAEDAANEQLKYVYKKYGDKFVVIGCGGVFGAEDAYRKIRLGASLVQLITGMIYEGPQLIGEINRGLVRLLERDGFAHISEAVGADNT